MHRPQDCGDTAAWPPPDHPGQDPVGRAHADSGVPLTKILMRLLTLYTALCGARVQRGPFRGMRYVSDHVCNALTSKLVGTYELEIADWIERLVARNYPTLLNIGAAEGYYAVGFARRCAGMRVVSFERYPHYRVLQAEIARRNGVAGRVNIEGWCDIASLRPHLAGPDYPLLIVDIEGGETTLLDPDQLPALRQCPMLVELHEWEEPAADILRTRFSASHQIEERWTRPRTAGDLPTTWRWATRVLRTDRFIRALAEHRAGPMRWFLLEPRHDTK